MALDTTDAIQLADWHIRYALDRLLNDPGALHPGVLSHLKAASVQMIAVVECLGQP